MDYKIPRGTYDVLPERSWLWQFVENAFREVAASYGYEQIITPIFEQSNLFERSSGENSDIVQKEMYRFLDRKERSFALRPEGTAPVVRSYVENRLDLKERISKLYYSGPMFRYDRPQAGRYRQFYQYGIELIGSDHPYFDAEVISLQWAFLKRLGLNDIRLEINSVGCPDCSADYETALRAYFEPHLQDLCSDCQTRFITKPRRLLDCKVLSCNSLAQNAPSQLDYLDEKCRLHFDSVCKFLNILEIPHTINPKIVRGLDYYTNTAFEFLNDALGAQKSIAGGGRYNGLIAQIGGRNVPAIGFAGGWERLLLSLEMANIIPGSRPKPTAYLVVMGSSTLATALTVLQNLRAKGMFVEFDPEKTSLKAQMKAANACGAAWALILGEDEIARGEIVLKNLTSGEQSHIPIADTQSLINTICGA